jgi:glutathionyl-hydroquinone reductase
MAKKEGTFDEFTEKGLKELDPASLPETLTEGNALLIDEMTTYNYKANYEQQQQLELLKKENAELKARLERLEKLIINK